MAESLFFGGSYGMMPVRRRDLMIPFHKLKLSERDQYNAILFEDAARGCEYSFANQVLWGRQQAAFLHGCVAIFSHFDGRSVYPFPIGQGDRKRVVEEILEDARERGLPCRITGILPGEWEKLEAWFPGRFHRRCYRDGFDYVYDINDLADLRGRRFQKKRNHFNRFAAEHPEYVVKPLDGENLPVAKKLVEDWYSRRIQEDPQGDYMLERVAIHKAFENFQRLQMEGLLLLDGGEAIAMTMGSQMGKDTFDIHFEKAKEGIDGAYAAINCEFARYLRLKHPEAAYLNREDDMGLEGLRKAKLSYNPHHMVEKCWAYLREEEDEH